VPSLPVIAVIAVCALALVNAVFGFLRSSELTGGTDDAVPLGSVYAVAGWIPALLVVSGLTAAATRLKGVSVATLWAVSAATAVMGGVGALFYLVAREGADAGLGFVLAGGEDASGDTTSSSASAGLILILIFGLLQMVAALGGLILTQSPQLTRRAAPAAADGRHDVAHRYGPGGGAPQAQPGYGPQHTPWGPSTGADPGRPPYGPGGASPFAPQSGAVPAQPPRYRDHEGGRPEQGPGWTSYQQSPGGFGGPQGERPPAGAGQGGYVAAHPAGEGIAPYGQYDQTRQFTAPTRPDGDERPSAPAGQPPYGGGQPSYYDPQSGQWVRTGLTASTPASPPASTPVAEPTPAQPGEAERVLRPDPAPTVEYQRTEYGSSDFEWEPTYSEAPTYEAQASEEQADQDPNEQVVRYQAPEQRAPFAPPKLDSGRHEGWNAGFADDTLTGTEQPPAQPGPRHRPITRSE
jgi:hypothetical protein